jgi:hypothetical protein
MFEKGKIYDILVIKEGIAAEVICENGHRVTLGLKNFKIV